MKSTVVEDATSAAPPATETASDGGQAEQDAEQAVEQTRRRAFELRRHVTLPTTARVATAAATFGGPIASHEKALVKKPTCAAATPVRHTVMARRMSTRPDIVA